MLVLVQATTALCLDTARQSHVYCGTTHVAVTHLIPCSYTLTALCRVIRRTPTRIMHRMLPKQTGTLRTNRLDSYQPFTGCHPAQTITMCSLHGFASIPEARRLRQTYALQISVNDRNPIRSSSFCSFYEQDHMELKQTKEYVNTCSSLIKIDFSSGLRPKKCEFTPPC